MIFKHQSKNKTLLAVLVILLLAVISFLVWPRFIRGDRKDVRNVVELFGRRLKTVSLQAPRNILLNSMQENYGDFVSQALIAKWADDPLNAPGTLTSSPWPDRIEILSVEKVSQYAYEVKGEIIEITSVEALNGGVAAKWPIKLTVEKRLDSKSWLITGVTLYD